MRHGSRRAKARRLEVHVAEALARAFRLTILAEKPTKPGKRNGVWWIGEGEMFPTQAAQELGLPGAHGLTREEIDQVKPCERLWSPDLKVRMMGQAGADVALLSPRAREAVSWQGRPLWIECKNMEGGWDLGKAFWEGRTPSGLLAAWNQAERGAKETFCPLVVIARNFWPPIAVVDWLKMDVSFAPCVSLGSGLSAMPFAEFVTRLGEKL